MISPLKIETWKTGPVASDFTAEELETLDIENLQETRLSIEFEKMTNDDYHAIAQFIQLSTKLPIKYLKPIANACSYVAQKARLPEGEKNIEKAAVLIEPLNPDWTNGQIRFLPINQSIPIDTVFTISKQIDYDGSPEWLMSSDIKCTTNLKDLILQENKNAKHFNLTNSKVYFFGLDIGSKLEGKFKVSWTDEIFNSMQLFRFKRPTDNKLILIIYDFLDIDFKYIFNLAEKTSNDKLCKEFCKKVLAELNK